MFGFNKKTLLKKTFQNITHPDDLKKDLAFVKDMLDGKRETYQMEKRYITKNKNIVWAQLSVSLVRNDDGTPRHFISHIEDITHQKQQAKELQEKITELEKMNDMMIGREEKMIEMKALLKKQQ